MSREASVETAAPPGPQCDDPLHEPHQAARRHRTIRFALVGILAVLVYLASFHLAGRVPVHGGLDPSWHAVLEYSTARDLRFGHDLIYTYGPLGYLYGAVGTGELMGRRIIFAFVWSILVAGAVLGLMRRISGPIRLLFPLLFLMVGDFSIAAVLLTLYAGWRLLDRDDRWWIDAALCLLLAMLSLVAFTFLVISLATAVVVVAERLAQRRFAPAVRLAVVAPLALAALWVVLNQRLYDLPLWIAGGFEIVSGYTEAMSLLPNPWVFGLAVGAGMMMMALVGLLVWPARRDAAAWGLGLLLLMQAFLAWKHGFVRADDHVFRFLYSLPVLACLGLAVTSADWTRCRYVASTILLVLLIGLCATAGYVQSAQRGSPINIATFAAKRPWVNAQIFGLTLRAAMTGEHDALRYHDWWTHQRVTETAKRLGDQPVDLINFQQGILLASGLNYRPRPVFQSFAAYTPKLQQRNLAFYHSPERPRNLLFELGSIDNRYPTLDDAPLLPLVLHNYQPVARDGLMLLLGQMTPSFEPVQYERVHEQTLSFGETLDLSPWNDRTVFAEVDVQRTAAGRLLKLAFQPGPVAIETRTAEGEWVAHRFIPAMAQRGFLLSPRLLSNDEVVALWGGQKEQRLRFVRFTLPFQDETPGPRAWGKIRVRLYHSPNFLEHHHAGLKDLRRFQSWVFNVRPLEFHSDVNVAPVHVDGLAALMVHAPGQVLLEAPPGSQRVTGRFGIQETAYTHGADTDGVGFIVEIEQAGGERRRAFERVLRPLERSEDRGTHDFAVELDPSVDRRIILLTDPAGNRRYDWSYWMDVRVE